MMKGLTQNTNYRPFYLFLSLVFAFHAAFLLSKLDWNLSFTPDETREEVTVIKLKLDSSAIKNQIVETLETNLKNIPVDKTYLGKKNNRVDRETKSQVVGSFNKAGVGQKEGFADKTTSAQKKKKKEVSLKDLSILKNPKDMARENEMMKQAMIAKGLKNGDQASRGLSQSNDFLEEVPLGDFTKLNTQEFEFYGFYHRIKLKLEQFWGKNIQEQADKLNRGGRRMPASDNHVTSLMVVINPNGKIIEVNVKSTSGIKELDTAAIDAFNQAGPFPNPPKGMIRDGKAVIEWGFVVNT